VEAAPGRQGDAARGAGRRDALTLALARPCSRWYTTPRSRRGFCEPEHRDSLDSKADRTLTTGEVQRNIRVGMSGAEVAEVLGSPNIVTTDEKRLEVWIYDRISTERAYSTSEGGLFLVLAGVQGSSGASRTSQNTLTVIVKFDEQGKVHDYAYHSSRF
jgi:hypothetical protein